MENQKDITFLDKAEELLEDKVTKAEAGSSALEGLAWLFTPGGTNIFNRLPNKSDLAKFLNMGYLGIIMVIIQAICTFLRLLYSVGNLFKQLFKGKVDKSMLQDLAEKLAWTGLYAILLFALITAFYSSLLYIYAGMAFISLLRSFYTLYENWNLDTIEAVDAKRECWKAILFELIIFVTTVLSCLTSPYLYTIGTLIYAALAFYYAWDLISELADYSYEKIKQLQFVDEKGHIQVKVWVLAFLLAIPVGVIGALYLILNIFFTTIPDFFIHRLTPYKTEQHQTLIDHTEKEKTNNPLQDQVIELTNTANAITPATTDHVDIEAAELSNIHPTHSAFTNSFAVLLTPKHKNDHHNNHNTDEKRRTYNQDQKRIIPISPESNHSPNQIARNSELDNNLSLMPLTSENKAFILKADSIKDSSSLPTKHNEKSMENNSSQRIDDNNDTSCNPPIRFTI